MDTNRTNFVDMNFYKPPGRLIVEYDNGVPDGLYIEFDGENMNHFDDGNDADLAWRARAYNNGVIGDMLVNFERGSTEWALGRAHSACISTALNPFSGCFSTSVPLTDSRVAAIVAAAAQLVDSCNSARTQFHESMKRRGGWAAVPEYKLFQQSPVWVVNSDSKASSPTKFDTKSSVGLLISAASDVGKAPISKLFGGADGMFTAEQLKANPPPDGVDPTRREQWLCEEEFEAIFEMPKEVSSRADLAV